MRLDAGWVSVGYLLPRAEASLEAEVFVADDPEMRAVTSELADLLLIPELTSATRYTPPEGPPGVYPRWATTYYAEPALGGENKRWLVVSHNHFNAGSGDALCVRTTSNTTYTGPEVPLIERGTAAAVCADIQTKAHRRFILDSDAELPQVTRAERRKVAIGLANYLGLQELAGQR